RAAAEHPPDVVVTDIRMPGMDGWELTRRLRARTDTAGAFVVALTGLCGPADRRRSAEAGVDVHLLNAVQPAALVALLERPTPAPPYSTCSATTRGRATTGRRRWPWPTSSARTCACSTWRCPGWTGWNWPGCCGRGPAAGRCSWSPRPPSGRWRTGPGRP